MTEVEEADQDAPAVLATSSILLPSLTATLPLATVRVSPFAFRFSFDFSNDSRSARKNSANSIADWACSLKSGNRRCLMSDASLRRTEMQELHQPRHVIGLFCHSRINASCTIHFSPLPSCAPRVCIQIWRVSGFGDSSHSTTCAMSHDPHHVPCCKRRALTSRDLKVRYCRHILAWGGLSSFCWFAGPSFRHRQDDRSPSSSRSPPSSSSLLRSSTPPSSAHSP